MAIAETAPGVAGNLTYQGLRGWLEEVDRLGELLTVNGAHWDREMGALTQMLTESSRDQGPAILFDDVPGYPSGYRTFYGHFSTVQRIALTLGLPLQYERRSDLVKAYYERMQTMTMLKPRVVRDGSSSRTSRRATTSTC